MPIFSLINCFLLSFYKWFNNPQTCKTHLKNLHNSTAVPLKRNNSSDADDNREEKNGGIQWGECSVERLRPEIEREAMKLGTYSIKKWPNDWCCWFLIFQLKNVLWICVFNKCLVWWQNPIFNTNSTFSAFLYIKNELTPFDGPFICYRNKKCFSFNVNQSSVNEEWT